MRAGAKAITVDRALLGWCGVIGCGDLAFVSLSPAFHVLLMLLELLFSFVVRLACVFIPFVW